MKTIYTNFFLHVFLITTCCLFNSANPINSIGNELKNIDENKLLLKNPPTGKVRKYIYTLDLPKPYTITYPKSFTITSQDVKSIATFDINCDEKAKLITFTRKSIEGNFNKKRKLSEAYDLNTMMYNGKEKSVGSFTYYIPNSSKFQFDYDENVLGPKFSDFCSSEGYVIPMTREIAIRWYKMLSNKLEYNENK